MRTAPFLLLLAAALAAPRGFADPLLEKKLSLLHPRAFAVASGMLDCSHARDLACGATVDSTTEGAPNLVTSYACAGFDESGGEAVYRIVLGARTQVSLSLTGAREDLDLFLLDSCDAGHCRAASTGVSNEAIRTCLDAGTYYAVVDGFNGASSPFSLDLDCQPCVTCVPAVPNDRCESAVVLPSQPASLVYTGSTCCAADDYDDGGCTGFSSLGRDVVYRLTMAPGCRLTATLRDGSDGKPLDRSMYLITSGADPRGTCVAGSDRGIATDETFTYQSDAGGVYYLVVDSFGNDTCGDYVLEIQRVNCSGVGVEPRAWQQVKQLYR